MAPKKAPEPEPVVNKAPEPGEVKYPEWTEAVLAAEPFALDAPFEDPAGLLLPADLYAGGEITWLRPSQFLPEGAVPCVVEQPAVAEGVAPPPPPRAMPNKLAVGTQLVPGAAPVDPGAGPGNGLDPQVLPTVSWLASCFQMVAMLNPLPQQDAPPRVPTRPPTAASSRPPTAPPAESSRPPTAPGAPAVPEPMLEVGAYLWESIYPKAAGGAPAYSSSGKYAIRLWEQGAWRLVVVDDRIPFDAHGRALLPLSSHPNELWPLLLAKALCKLGAPYATSLSQDAAVLWRLTGWLPEQVPIAPCFPAEAAFDTLAAALAPECQCAVGVMLPAGEVEALAEVGLYHGPLVVVRDARELEGRDRYVRLETEVMEWTGPLCDTDEPSWSHELADALSWKRLQRLRLRGAGVPLYDWWLSNDSLNGYFSGATILHRPYRYACIVTHRAVAKAAPGAPPALLHVGGDAADGPAEVLFAVGVTPQEGLPVADGDPVPPPFGSCVVAIEKYDWTAPAPAATLLQLTITTCTTVVLTLERGTTYRITAVSQLPDGYRNEPPEVPTTEAEAAAEEGAPETKETPVPTPPAAVASACHVAFTACSDAPLSLGELSVLSKNVLSLQLLSLSGELPEMPAGQWVVGASIALKPTVACTVCAKLVLADPLAAATARLHLVCEEPVSDQKECTSFDGLVSGGFDLDPAQSPNGYTLLFDLKPMSTLPPSGWSLLLTSTSEVAATVTPLKPSALSDVYQPNASYKLCRLVLNGAVTCTTALHVGCTLPTALVHARAFKLMPPSGEPPYYAQERVLAEGSGLGCVSLMAVGVDAAVAPPPPAKGKKGEPEPPPAPKTQIILEVMVDTISGLELGLRTRPRKPELEPEDEPDVGWTVTACAKELVGLAKDSAREQEIAALAASWESSAPGRAAKAKGARETYLAGLAAAAAEAEAARVAAAEAAEAARAAETAAAIEASRAAAMEMGEAEIEERIAEYGLEPTGEDKEALVEQLVQAQAAAAAQEAAESAAFAALELDATATADEEIAGAPTAEVDPPRTVRRVLAEGAEARLVPSEEWKEWKDAHAERLNEIVGRRTERATKRGGMKDELAAVIGHTITATKAKRPDAASAYASAVSARQELLGKFTKEPPPPVEEKPAKGKKK